MDKWVRILAFFVASNVTLLAGAGIFMYIEYSYTAADNPRNFTELKTTINHLVRVQLNDSAVKKIVDITDEYVRSNEDCKSQTYKRGWKKVLNARTYLRWCYFSYTVVTTIGKFSHGLCKWSNVWPSI